MVWTRRAKQWATRGLTFVLLAAVAAAGGLHAVLAHADAPVTYHVSGTITDTTGAPVPGAGISVGILNPNGSYQLPVPGQTTSAADGTYAVDVPAASNYHVDIGSPSVRWDSASFDNVAVTADRTLDAVLTAYPVRTFSGNVVDAAGKPMDGVKLSIDPATAAGTRGLVHMAQDDNHFSVLLREDTYTVTIGRYANTSYTLSTTVGSATPVNSWTLTGSAAYDLTAADLDTTLHLPAVTPQTFRVQAFDRNGGDTTALGRPSSSLITQPQTLGSPEGSYALTVIATLSGFNSPYVLAQGAQIATGDLCVTLNNPNQTLCNTSAVDVTATPVQTFITPQLVPVVGFTAPTPINHPVLTWHAEQGVDHYVVYREAVPYKHNPVDVIGTTTDATFTDTATLPEGDYQYYVQAVDPDGSSTYALVCSPSGVCPNYRTVTVDTTPPSLTDVAVTPANTTPSQGAVLSATTDGVAVEYFSGADPGTGQGIPLDGANGNFSSPVFERTAPLQPGTYVLHVRARDAAGNWTAAQDVTLTVTPDVPPTPTGLTAPSPTNAGPALSWNAAAGASSYIVYRDGAAVASPTQTTYTDNGAAEGAHTYAVASVSQGGASAATDAITVTVDKTAPVLGAFSWSANPKATTQSSALGVSASDTLTGIAGGEYFLGDTDPGTGSGVAMQWDGSGHLTATFDTSLASGVYKVTVRAQDFAGNWSGVASDYLVVYNPLGFSFTGKRTVVPSLAGGDVLPGLISASQTDAGTFGFSVAYDSQGHVTAGSSLQFAYTTGTKCNNPAKAVNCHSLNLNATTIAWMVTQGANNSTGVFQGTGTLTVDGATITVPFRVTGLDGTRLSPTANDQFQIEIYAAGSNPATAPAQYRLNSKDIARGNVRIR
ncbi:MAG TPA: hypothetical protein VLF71_02590 [Candidatus Saccharimonadales bacterium]|nr:hypothetical protein [Candidatus Saccharimonadales bacterium]